MVKSPYPLLSIITPTLNNEKTIPTFLKYLQRQAYPQEHIEILFVDGGSTDQTLELAKRHKITVLRNPYILAEPATYIGMNKAKGDLFMVLATDNYFLDSDALSSIVRIFQDRNIYAAFPKHDNEPHYSLFSKYHNTFTDPFNHFIYGYGANGRTFKNIYKTLEHNGVYDVYDFNSNEVKPMIALAQGLTIRRNYARKQADAFDDCRPIIDLIEQNKKIAYVHSVSVYHDTIHGLKHFIRKQRWATQNALERKNYGISYRFNKLSPRQKVKVWLWPFYALSILLPLIRGLYGTVKDREMLWLFHPIGCWLSAYASLMQVIHHMYRTRNISRQT